MNVLVIEDSSYKAMEIISYLKKCNVDSITHKCSRNSGLYELQRAEKENNPYNYLILDMQLPIYDNEFDTLEKDAGLDILREIRRLKDIRNNCNELKVIMCSCEDVSKMTNHFENVIGHIIYSPFVDLTPNFEKLILEREEVEKEF